MHKGNLFCLCGSILPGLQEYREPCTSAIWTSIACSMSCVNRGAPSAAQLPSPVEQLWLWDSCKATPDMRQKCKSATSLAHAVLHAHTWHFLHSSPLCLRVRVFPHALHIVFQPRLSFVLRLITSHVMVSCVGVKHIPGASGESRVVSGPSPGYPHVISISVSVPVSVPVSVSVASIFCFFVLSHPNIGGNAAIGKQFRCK